MQNPADLIQKLNSAPDKPGVYLLKNSSGRAIYVGKAKRLNNRLRSYFSKESDTRYQMGVLKQAIADFDYIITGNEKESLILENELIKKYKPKFNIKLKDDKSFVTIRITTNHPFPMIHVLRKPVQDGSLIFGPYSSARDTRKTLKLLLKAFPMRSCTDDEFKRRTRPCILYEIKQCSAPCVGSISAHEYSVLVKEMVQFLRGKKRELIDSLRGKMLDLSIRERFEEAAQMRDRVLALEKTIESQRIVSSEPADRDVFWVANQSEIFSAAVLNVRQGILQNVSTFYFSNFLFGPEELLSSLISQYYDHGNFIPDELILGMDIPDKRSMEERLGELRGRSIRIFVPVRGERRALVELARMNADSVLEQKIDSAERASEILNEIKAKFGMEKIPKTIEAIDISNISGRHAVGAKVAFVNGCQAKSLYRLYRVKSVQGSDDYGMIREVLSRRIRQGIEENNLPDLMLIDGGRGHLSAAVDVLNMGGVEGMFVAGIAKGERSSSLKQYTEDHFYLSVKANPVFFRNNSSALLLLKRIRDEAHRFAVKYHRKLRNKKLTESVLKEIPGIGPKRQKLLLTAFGSVEMLKGATIEEIKMVNGMTKETATMVYKVLHGEANV
ncbi:MAG TPA: excinuclease ABC subunit UvrC [bacterium]